MENKINLLMEMQSQKSIEELKEIENNLLNHFFIEVNHKFKLSELLSRLITTDLENCAKVFLRYKKQKLFKLKEVYSKRSAKSVLMHIVNAYLKALKPKNKKKELTKEQKEERYKWHVKYKKDNYFSFITIYDENVEKEIEIKINALNENLDDCINYLNLKVNKNGNVKKITKSLILNIFIELYKKNKTNKEFLNNLKEMILKIKQDERLIVNKSTDLSYKQSVNYISIINKDFYQTIKKQFDITTNQLFVLAINFIESKKYKI